jgi:hypothetical protein
VASATPRATSEAPPPDLASERWAFVLGLATRPPSDPAAVLAGARRLGFDLHSGAVGVCAHGVTTRPELAGMLSAATDGRLLALLSIKDDAHAVSEALRTAGLRVGVSSPRTNPIAFHDALREAELLLELGELADDDTCRLLIRILLRDRDELEQLNSQTVSLLARYDSEHDTELVETLRTFLVHHGSTTDTAHAMNLHRHTVGYRLTRVHEVSGLSPYESGGRERLGLGLKAHQILRADRARTITRAD